jgi:Tat protein secretion system quality control protein TatD with DNase activity
MEVPMRQRKIVLFQFFFIVLVAMVVSCAKPPSTPVPQPTPTPTPTPAYIPTGRFPLVDAHNHLPRGVTLDSLIHLMEESGVQMTVLMPVFYGRDDPRSQGITDENLVLEFYTKRPDRIIPILGMQRPPLLDPKRWQQPDAMAERILKTAEYRLGTGFYKGIGEFILWHYPYSYSEFVKGGMVKIHADTPLMKRFLDLAAKYQVPVVIHYEIDEESLPSLKRMLEYGRKTTIILAHNGGRPDLSTLKAILEKYPNVFCDLGGMTHLGHYGHISGNYKKNPIDDGT